MQYMPSVAFQAVCFMYSAGLGFSLAIVYDLIRIIFYLLTGSDKKQLALRDIIFLTICLWVNFIFLLTVCEGEIFAYTFLAEAGGAFVWFYSLSSVFFIPAKRAIKALKRHFLRQKECLRRIKTRIFNFIEKIFENLNKTVKKYLHIRHSIVYNFFVKLCSVSLAEKKRGGRSVNKDQKS